MNPDVHRLRARLPMARTFPEFWTARLVSACRDTTTLDRITDEMASRRAGAPSHRSLAVLQRGRVEGVRDVVPERQLMPPQLLPLPPAGIRRGDLNNPRAAFTPGPCGLGVFVRRHSRHPTASK